MNISLPDALKAFVDKQVDVRGYGTSSEYVRELIRKDQDMQRHREMLLDVPVLQPPRRSMPDISEAFVTV